LAPIATKYVHSSVSARLEHPMAANAPPCIPAKLALRHQLRTEMYINIYIYKFNKNKTNNNNNNKIILIKVVIVTIIIMIITINIYI
jgi:hypothetical protein